jgi:hypothetical protein
MSNVAFPSRRKAYELWLAALESGKYQQARGKLKRISREKTPSFCCLGVVCDLNVKAGGPEWDGRDYLNTSAHLPTSLHSFLAITDTEAITLINLNDIRKMSFKEIAAHIRKEVMPKALKRATNYRIR